MSFLTKKTETGSFPLFGRTIEYRYDRDVDALTLIYSEHSVVRTQELEGLGLMDLDAAGELVALEVFSAKKVVRRMIDRLSAPKVVSDEMPPIVEGSPSEDLLDALARAVTKASEEVKALT